MNANNHYQYLRVFASICGYLFAPLNGSASLCLTASGGGLPDFN